MNDTVIFMVGLGVLAIAITSTFFGLIASDYPDEGKAATSEGK